MSQYEFPECMHVLSAGLHMQNIDPATVTISLPFDQWWRLQCAIDRKYGATMVFDGRGGLPKEFRYMGFRFVQAAAESVSAAA